MEQLDDYIADMQALKDKYRDQIDIKIALECEYFPRYFDWLRSVKDRFDYLLLGVHCSEHDEHLHHCHLVVEAAWDQTVGACV
jgi:histidinol-phosphatase (PHP family)